MLVLTRREQGRIKIGKDIEIVIVQIQGDRVRIGIEAPKEMQILRDDAITKTKGIK